MDALRKIWMSSDFSINTARSGQRVETSRVCCDLYRTDSPFVSTYWLIIVFVRYVPDRCSRRERTPSRWCHTLSSLALVLFFAWYANGVGTAWGIAKKAIKLG